MLASNFLPFYFAITPKWHPVTDTPKGFKKWVKDHKEQIQGAKNPPYWVRNNKAVVNGIWWKKKVNIADKTPKTAIKNSRLESRKKEYQKLLADSNYKEVEFDEKTGGLKATHTNHNFDKQGGRYEIHVQNAGFKARHVVILENELGTTIGERFTEGTWDGSYFKVAGRETATSNNILRGLKHCAAKRKTKITILDFPNIGFNEEIFDSAVKRYRGLEKLNGGQYLKFDKIICVQDESIIKEIIF